LEAYAVKRAILAAAILVAGCGDGTENRDWVSQHLGVEPYYVSSQGVWIFLDGAQPVPVDRVEAGIRYLRDALLTADIPLSVDADYLDLMFRYGTVIIRPAEQMDGYAGLYWMGTAYVAERPCFDRSAFVHELIHHVMARYWGWDDPDHSIPEFWELDKHRPVECG
jgi:hypothetical protein